MTDGISALLVSHISENTHDDLFKKPLAMCVAFLAMKLESNETIVAYFSDG